MKNNLGHKLIKSKLIKNFINVCTLVIENLKITVNL